MSTLEIRGLKVSVDTEQGSIEILKGVDLTINCLLYTSDAADE